MNNRAIRTAMFKAGLNQRQLASILGTSDASVSIMLSRELSRTEQKKIVAMINSREVLSHEEDQDNPSSI